MVDLKNPKRVIHALEICYMTGRTYTSFRTQQKKQRSSFYFFISFEPGHLFTRINAGVLLDFVYSKGADEKDQHHFITPKVTINLDSTKLDRFLYRFDKDYWVRFNIFVKRTLNIIYSAFSV